MNKKTFTFLLIFLFFPIFLFYSCSSPQSTEPLQRAEIDVDVDVQHITFKQVGDSLCADFTVIISETNGVGGRVSTLRIQIFSEDTLCVSYQFSGGNFQANGTLEIDCSDICVDPTCDYDKMEIRAEGTDDNAFKFNSFISIDLS